MTVIGRAQVFDQGGIDMPGMDRPDFELPDVFGLLDAGLPLLLLPVRIETRYVLTADPPELRIRIYPDQIHIDADRPGAGTGEAEATTQFWREWHAAKGETGRRRAWNTHVTRVGPVRAGHLARLLQPRAAQSGELIFPTIGGVPPRAPGSPVLLPEKWLAVGYSGASVLFERESLPIAPELRTAPDPQAPPWRAPQSGLNVDEAMAWMFDYDRAVEAGMAITVPLTGAAAGALEEVSTLLVVGASNRYQPNDVAVELDRLLGAHARTDGLAFMPQGTPTNNTESVVSGVPTAAEPAINIDIDIDIDVIDFDVLDSMGPANRAAGPIEVASGDNAHRLAAALGLADTGTLAAIPYATDQERKRSRAMIRVTFEAILGAFVRQLLRVGDTNALSPAALTALKDWCVTHVTGGAPYPCLRVGPQPYGILPVRRATSSSSPQSTAEHVQSVVSLLIGQWRRAVTTVPHLDPNRGADQETDIATVLATQPHPARFFVRRLAQFSDLNVFEEFLTPQWWYSAIVLDQIELGSNPDLVTPYREVAMVYAIVSNDVVLDSVEDQIGVWLGVRGYLPGYLTGQPQDVIDDGLGYVDSVLSLLYGYQSRQNPVRDLDLLAFAGALGEQSTELIEGVMYGTSDEWGEVGLVQAPGAPAGHTTADYLADLRARFAARGATLPPSTMDADFLASQPLLYQLLDRSLYLVPDSATEEAAVLAALDTLAPRSAEDLLWLMRESLGLGAHRLDAWATSLATERLTRLREAKPTGIQIGAYAWVTGLKPRDTDVEAAGFVHAPSMAHATTAALLRAGWLTHGSDDPLSPAAVNYTSARVRAASWLLDGVRQGQRLGDLLGYRFERALHDRHADEQIRPLREKVLAATGRPELPPDEPVDGIELLDLFRSGDLGPVEIAVAEALAEIEDAFDATNDVALVEAVHQLAMGNHERATAVLGALTGTHSPPELRAPRTPRAGTSVEHRVLILLDPHATRPDRGWVNGIRDRVAPALDAWVAGLLPRADSVGFTAYRAAGDAPMTGTLAGLGLSALDAIYLVGDDPAAPTAALRTLASAEQIDPAARGDAPIALSEFAVLAIELRRAIDSLRVASARDLQPGYEAIELELDDSAALDTITTLVAEFEAMLSHLDVGATRRLALVGLAATDPAQLAAAATRRLANVLAIEVDPADRRAGLRKRLAALVGGTVPILGRFPLTAALTPIASASEVDTWLDTVAMVRPSLTRLTCAGMLSELLTSDGGLRATAAQLPAVPGDRWAATGPVPPGTGGRLNIVAVGGIPANTVACGLVVDAWSERIPRAEQDTGLALQFDAPSNRPPQTWLLAVTPDGEDWSRQLVLDTLTETLEWATLRAVGTEDLLDYGRAIPTIYAPGSIINWPTED